MYQQKCFLHSHCPERQVHARARMRVCMCVCVCMHVLYALNLKNIYTFKQCASA